MSAIDVRGLRKEFGDVVAVNGVDLAVQDGEFFTLLGPSGSGKTTILRAVAGLELPTAGTIKLGGEVTQGPPYDREVNTVFQDYALFPHMSVRENIAYGLEIRGVEKEHIDRRVERMLEMVSLPEVSNRSVSELSGGQQQRIALARALAVEPKVLLLDEPLGALDEKLRREMQIELKGIQEELKTTFLYVTHDQEEALSMSDRIAVMDGGGVVQVGSPKEVYERPRTRFIAEFFRGSNIFTADVEALTDGEAVLDFEGETVVAERSGDLDIREGDSVSFFVRAERVEADADAANTLFGTVTNTVYKGSESNYAVVVGDHVFTIALRKDHYAVGDRLTIGWEPGHTVLLHD